MGCNCHGGKSKAPNLLLHAQAVSNNLPDGKNTKITCRKCGYWMSLVVTPSTKERQYQCQNTMCKSSMPVSLQSPQPSL